MIQSTRSTVRILDLYFDEPRPAGVRVDILRCNQFSRPIPDSYCTPFSTIVLDLSLPADALFANVKPQTRYKIRRASDRDRLVYGWSAAPDSDQVMRFANYFDQCAALKGIAKASRQRLMVLARQGALGLSWILDDSGAMVAANCYLVTASRARILHTGAAFRSTSDSGRRNMIGRANRHLYWQDILRFREAQIPVFDFGGWYAGGTDTERLRINHFKEEFGGEVRHEWNCQQGMTVTGSLALAVLRRMIDFIGRKHAATVPPQQAEETA